MIKSFEDSGIDEYLKHQPKGKEFVIASFFVTNADALLKLRASWALRSADHGKVINQASERVKVAKLKEFGGSIALVDPVNLCKGFIAEIKIPLAFGLCIDKIDGSLYVASGSVIRQVKYGSCIRVLNHPLFNDLHSLTLSCSNNLLVSSTGLDTILEIDFANPDTTYWDWIATENGYNTTPSGKVRIINRHKNYQSQRIITPNHTTHINTALNDRPDRVLATLFHQGTLIEIDKLSKQNRIILSQLKSPHNIRKRNNGFMLSDTRANRILLLDFDFSIEAQITGGLDWVQDAIELSQGDSYLAGDSNNDRLVLFNKLGVIDSVLIWPEGSRKIASLETVTAAEARNIFLPQNANIQNSDRKNAYCPPLYFRD